MKKRRKDYLMIQTLKNIPRLYLELDIGKEQEEIHIKNKEHISPVTSNNKYDLNRVIDIKSFIILQCFLIRLIYSYYNIT